MPFLSFLFSISALGSAFASPTAYLGGLNELKGELWTARAVAGLSQGAVPVFRAAERDRLSATVVAGWRVAKPVHLDLRVSGLQDRYASGARQTGWGDIRLGTGLSLWEGGGQMEPGFGLGWQAKLPNAQDEGELGTDETDFRVVGHLAMGGTTRVAIVGGLDILGNPLRFANQDDVPLSWLQVTHGLGPLSLSSRIGGGWATSRNPARHELDFAVEGSCPWRMGAEGVLGLTPAAPDWGVRLWVGWGSGCLSATGD